MSKRSDTAKFIMKKIVDCFLGAFGRNNGQDKQVSNQPDDECGDIKPNTHVSCCKPLLTCVGGVSGHVVFFVSDKIPG